MKLRTVPLALLASACVCLGDTPTKYYDIDFAVSGSQFGIDTKIRNTPRLVFNMKENEVAFDAAGYTNILRYAKNRDAAAMASIYGTISTTQAVFDTESGDFPHEMEDWYCVMMLVMGDQTHSYAEGVLNVTRGNEATAPAALTQTYAINGSEYGPFTGNFSDWPFVSTGLVSYVYNGDSYQAGISTNDGSSTVVMFPTAYTGGVPVVHIEEAGGDFAYEAVARPINVTMNGFTYSIRSAAGVVTNAWRVYWSAVPEAGHGVAGYTDAQSIAAVSATLGEAAYADVGTGATELPTWAQVQAAITNLGSGDVYASSNNAYATSTTQAFDYATARSFSVPAINRCVNGTFDADVSWTYDTEWTITGGAAICATQALGSATSIYNEEEVIIAGHTYRISYDLTVGATGLTMFAPMIGDNAGSIQVASGSYTEDITVSSATDDAFGFIVVAIATPNVNISIDNVTLIDLSREVEIADGAMTIGGETVTYDKIKAWDAPGITSEADPVWLAQKSAYQTVAATTASLALETLDKVMERGNTTTKDLVMSGTYPKIYGNNNAPLILGGHLGSSRLWIGPTNAIPNEKFIWDPPFFSVMIDNSFGIRVPTNGRFVVQSGWDYALWSDPAEKTWNFFGGTLSNAVFSGVIAPTNNINLAGHTISNGTFSGTHTGVGSGLTGVNPFTTAWRLPYSNGSAAFSQLAFGSSGQFLKSNGSSAAPSWQTISLIATATNVALADLTDTVGTNYFVVGDGAHLATQSLEDVQTLLGIGAATNIQFSAMQMSGTSNDIIRYDGSTWTNAQIIHVLVADITAAGGGSGTGIDADSVDGIDGSAFVTTSDNIDSLANVVEAGAVAGNILGYDGANWVPTNDVSSAADTNALQALWRADDDSVSNALVLAYEAADAALRNAMESADAALSNAFVLADTALSNAFENAWQADDTALSNAFENAWQADDTALSNALTLAYATADGVVSNFLKEMYQAADAVVANASTAYTDGKAALMVRKDGSVAMTGSLLPSTSNTLSLGSLAKPWKEIYVGASSLHAGTSTVTQASINRWNQTADGIFDGNVSIAGNLTVAGTLSVTGTLTCSAINLNGTTITDWYSETDTPLPAGQTRINIKYSPYGTYVSGTLTLMAWNTAACEGPTIFSREYDVSDLRFNPTYYITNNALMVGSTYWFAWMDTDDDGQFNRPSSGDWASTGVMDEPAAYGEFMPYVLAAQSSSGTINFWMLEKKGCTPRFGLIYDQTGETYDITIRNVSASGAPMVWKVDDVLSHAFQIEPHYLLGDDYATTGTSYGGLDNCTLGSSGTGIGTLQVITNGYILGAFNYGRNRGIVNASGGSAPVPNDPTSLEEVASSTITFKFTNQYTDYSAMELVVNEGAEGGTQVYSYIGYMENEHFDDGTTWHKATLSGLTPGTAYYWRVRNRFGSTCTYFSATAWSSYGSFTYQP